MSELLLVRLLRSWHAAREAELPALPYLTARALEWRVPPITAVACASLFALLEASLSRQLAPECCCSPSLSADERALVGLVHNAPLTPAAAPLGMARAAHCAALAVRQELVLGCARLS
jgi:hypothetical protein